MSVKLIDEVNVYASANGQRSKSKKMTGPGGEVSQLRLTAGNDYLDGRSNSGTITIREIYPRELITVNLSIDGRNQTTPIQVELNWTVRQLKSHLKSDVGVDHATSNMVLREQSLRKELKDDKRTLGSYGIKSGTVIEVFTKSSRGG